MVNLFSPETKALVFRHLADGIHKRRRTGQKQQVRLGRHTAMNNGTAHNT